MTDWTKIVAHRMLHLGLFVRVGFNLAQWCFSRDGKLLHTTSSYAQELGSFLEIGGCKEFALGKGQETDNPFVTSDSLGLVWIGQYAVLTENLGRVLVLLGPMFTSESSLKTIENRMMERHFSPQMLCIGRRVLVDVPVLPAQTIHQILRILHFAATEDIFQPESILYQSDMPDDPILAAIQGMQTEKHFLDHERAYAKEQQLLQCIREGNLNYAEIIRNYPLSALPDNYMTGDPLREAKLTLTLFISNCSKAAVDGKLSIKTAKDIEIHAVRRVEQCQTITQLIKLRRDILKEYVQRVHELTEQPGISRPILASCDYIKAHVTEPIELSDIAKAVGYAEYYLSRKFQKELGIRINDYIRQVRLDYAKIWLLSTEDTIQEISERLQFQTRNYFSRVFKKQEGMTPQEFRDQARSIQQ